MIWILAMMARAEEPVPCYFEKPITIIELKEAMKTCYLPVESRITIQVEDVNSTEPRPGIGFRINDSELTTNGKETLDGVASVLTIRKMMNIKVVGYADSAEMGDLLDLSLRRAIAASTYLTGKGIDPSRVSVEAAGAEKPVDLTGTAEGHARNRRIEFVVSSP